MKTILAAKAGAIWTIGALALVALLLPGHALAAAVPEHRTTFGIPSVFYLFGLLLFSIAILHKHALAVALGGFAIIFGYRTFIDAQGLGPTAAVVGHEWVTLTNLLLLLLGFELLSNQFERSHLPDRLPRLLPDGWRGGLVLLAMVFIMSGFLDNIAAAVIGGVMARHAYQGRVSIGFLAGIVASANVGGAGSVIGDTTTTLMWLKGVSPITVFPAYLGAVAAFAVFGIAAALSQQRYQPVDAHADETKPIAWRRLGIVAFILLAAVATNVAANALSEGEETAPWLGLAVWVAILVTSPAAQPDWRLLRPALNGALFLVALVATAGLMPLASLPEPSWGATFALGWLSSVFDNIPLTALSLNQGGHDWALLAYAVGFGGSMVWFGSSAGVALTNLYPEGRSVFSWLKQGWFVPVGYVVGFFTMLLVLGWRPAAGG
jgi:Na+/H+ antiporter NhaD/arsenite permease-like protein